MKYEIHTNRNPKLFHFHFSRLLSYAEKTDIARPLYRFHDVLFVLSRLGSITLAVLIFWHGLAKAPEAEQVINWQIGTFNTPMFRITALVSICVLQVPTLLTNSNLFIKLII